MAGRLDNNRYTKEKNTSLKLSSGLTEAPKFVQSEEGQDLVNTPLALSMEKILVKGDLHVEGDITAGDKKIIGDITQITKGVGVDTKTTESGHYNILFTGGSGVNVGMTALTDTIAITGTDADTDNKGVVELATTAETTTGTDTDRAVTPDGLKDGFEGSTNITKVGALDTGGSITSGFGSIDVGSSTIDTTGDVSVGNLQVSGQDIAFDASDSGIEINPSAHHLVGKELLISSGSPTAGTTSNVAGGDLIIAGGRGKGNAAGGAINFKAAVPGASGTSSNSLATLVKINADGTNPTLEIAAPTLIASGANNRAVYITQELSQNTAAIGTQTYTMVGTNLTETYSGGWDNIYLIDQQVGGSSKFKVTNAGAATFASTVTSSNGVCSGTGALDTGSSSITTTGDVEGGTISATSPTLTAAGSSDYSIKSEQILNDTSATGGTQEYAQIWTELTATDLTGWDKIYLTHQQVDGASKFRVDSTGDVISAGTVTSSNGVSGRFTCSSNYHAGYRMSTVDWYYVGNQNFNTSITANDWSGQKFNYASYTSTNDVKLQEWAFVGEFSSSVDYEVELWDLTIPANGTAEPSTAAKVGSTQSVSATALAIYTLGQDSLDYTVAAGHQLYMLIRYTSGSGTKYSYGTMTMEFTNG